MIYIDFEFNRVTEEKVNLVCCAIYDSEDGSKKKIWLHNDNDAKLKLKNFLEHIRKSETIVAWQASAEARSFYSLGTDPYYYDWIDLFLEYRCLSNHHDKYNYGQQLVDGKIKTVQKPKPKWERTEEDSASGFKPTHSLAEATFKLTGTVRDTEHKTKMRDLIISDPESFTEEEKEAIMDYCLEDVVHLPLLHLEMIREYKSRLGSLYNKSGHLEEMKHRAKYNVLCGIKECWGYPINYNDTKNFSDSVASILDDCQRDINRLFPDIKPFKFVKKTGKFSWNQIKTKEWIKNNCQHLNWIKTDTGDYSLSLEAWQKHFNYTHEYPDDSFPAQMVRYLKLKQSLNGFVPGGKKSFWDAVGSDKRVRPYINCYGSLSSRNQPGSTSFLLLKPAWQRSLLQPPKGKCITSIDYGSEEYFIAALFYNDLAMIKAYLSGDVYLAYAKDAGMVPKDGTKEKYKTERNLAKSTVLGLSFRMSKYGLSAKLTNDTGRKWTEDQAQEMIDLFYEAYPDWAEGNREIIKEYYQQGFLKLFDGWYLWGDNDNERSVGNFPIQGRGAVILRKAEMLCYERGVKVILPLHDALYIEHDMGDFKAIDILRECMVEAFCSIFPKNLRKYAEQIRLDPFTWGSDLEEGTITTPGGWKVDCAPIYIDERATREYEKFSRYFEAKAGSIL